MLLASCGSDSFKQPKKKILPKISGKAGEVEVVCSKGDWDAEPGAAIRAVLAAECPYLPQPEALYTLFNVPFQAFNKVFQVHRNVIYMNIGPEHKEPQFQLNRDIWAEPQTVVLVEAPDAVSAAVIIEQNAAELLAIFEQAERDRNISAAKEFVNKEVRDKVIEFIGGSPYFPTGYCVKKVDEDFMWISYETTFTNQGFLIYRFPYEKESQLSAEELALKRDEVTKIQIPCTTENSYMIINPMIKPGYEVLKYKGREFAEMRGLWEAYNDFMGGPYISHTFMSRDGKSVIVVDGFVYAPKYPKRNYLKQVESILYSFEWQ